MPQYIYRGKAPCRIGTVLVREGDRVELPGPDNDLFEPVAPVIEQAQEPEVVVERVQEEERPTPAPPTTRSRKQAADAAE